MSDSFIQEAIGKIYDCAVEQSQWDNTLGFIRDHLDFAFVSLQFLHFPDEYPAKPPETIMFRTEWDEGWLEALQPHIATIPKFDQLLGAEIDVPMSQLRVVDEREFQQSPFFREWVEPQGLRDTLNTNVIRRGNMTAILSAPTYRSRPLFSDKDFGIMRALTPHIRRALLIADLLDEQNAQIQILRRTLDRLAVAVILVEPDGKVVYANSTGEDLLSSGTSLTAVSNRLWVRSETHREGFATAVVRACSGNDIDIQSWGNGIPLPGSDGRTAIAYVLPLGKSERRRALGPGLAAVFITTDGKAIPPSIEVISAVTGLTTAEANVALGIATGATPHEVAERLDVSIHTVRKHLANAFDKTGLRSQVALTAVINRMSLPAS